MVLRELGLRDWWRVIYRELSTGAALGSVLAAIGMTRLLLWQVLPLRYVVFALIPPVPQRGFSQLGLHNRAHHLLHHR